MADIRFLVLAEKPEGSNEPSYTLVQHPKDRDRRMRDRDIVLNAGERFSMKFILRDHSGMGLKFAPGEDGPQTKPEDVTGPFWVKAGDACPKKRGNTKVFEVKRKDDNEIVVVNKISDENKYQYSLNFIDDQNIPRPYDPVIENGGGHRKWPAWVLLVVGACGGAAFIEAAHYAGLLP